VISVRTAGPDDAAVVHALTQAAFAGQERLTPPSGALSETEDDVRAQLAAWPGGLAYDGDTAVGAYRLEEHDDGTLHVRRVSVHPDARGRGVARALIAHAEAYARSLGRAELRLGCRDELPDNVALFQHLGYEIVAVHEFWVELAKGLT
jgi:GNAT superfamily N-acetyltransferase